MQPDPISDPVIMHNAAANALMLQPLGADNTCITGHACELSNWGRNTGTNARTLARRRRSRCAVSDSILSVTDRYILLRRLTIYTIYST